MLDVKESTPRYLELNKVNACTCFYEHEMCCFLSDKLEKFVQIFTKPSAW